MTTTDPPIPRRRVVRNGRRLLSLLAAVSVAGAVALGGAACSGDDDDAGAEPSEDSAFIEGQVTSGEAQPEAGVWVIAETESLPTPYRKIVVTDEQGRFVLPQLPEADYELWVRGYGLADSEPVPGALGEEVALTATPAASEQEAAAIYPANYWLSLLEPPTTPPEASGRSTANEWMSSFKLGCQLCHQIGSEVTRVGTRESFDIGLKKARNMDSAADGLGREAVLDALADWSGRIQAGAVPEAPPRPEGVERNLVISQWAWGDEFTYAHDEVATDKRDPTLNANGPIWGVDLGNDRLLSVDPVTHEAQEREVPTLDGFDTPWCEQTYQAPVQLEGRGEPEVVGFGTLGCPAGDGTTEYEGAYDNPANPHNPMMDADGTIWMTTQIRREHAEDLPEFCKDDPVIYDNSHHRQLGYFDPETEETELIDTCYGTHHLQFDDEGMLWVSGDSYVTGWFDPSVYDPERPETLQEAQGWSEMSVDSDGDGEKDLPIPGFNYGIIPNPVDGSVWTAQPSTGERGAIVRYDPETDMHETYHPPAPLGGPRGIDIDQDGNLWIGLGGSGHLARFDRSRCEQTWGTGDQCPEGWTMWVSPGPEVETGDGPRNQTGADFHYYIWVDQFDTLGMGPDTVILNGTGSDSLLAFDRETEEFTTIRVPYPLNLFTRGLDGRIDDPDAGWKGRGLWFDNGGDPIIHSEIQQSYVGQVQMRPDPLAR